MKTYSKSMQEYFKTVDDNMSMEEKLGFQQAYITSLKKELSDSQIECGKLRSELDEAKFKINELRNSKSLAQQVEQLKETNKQLRIAKGELAQQLDHALKLSLEDKMKVKRDKEIEAMKVQISAMSKNITKLRQDKEALIISLGKIKLV